MKDELTEMADEAELQDPNNAPPGEPTGSDGDGESRGDSPMGMRGGRSFR